MIIIAILLTSALWLFIFRAAWLPSAQAEESKLVAEVRADRDHLRLQLGTLLNHLHAPRTANTASPATPPPVAAPPAPAADAAAPTMQG